MFLIDENGINQKKKKNEEDGTSEMITTEIGCFARNARFVGCSWVWETMVNFTLIPVRDCLTLGLASLRIFFLSFLVCLRLGYVQSSGKLERLRARPVHFNDEMYQ